MKSTSLTLFNERVERLERTALAKRMATPNYKMDYERMMNREFVSADGVTEDDVDAFVLSLRLLIQDNDGYSIRCLADDIYSDESVPTNLRSRFNAARERWKQHCAQKSAFKLSGQDSNLENGHTFDVILYGGLAHTNRDKVNDFHMLAKRGAFSSLVFASFLHMLNLLLSVVREIRDVNNELLRIWGKEC
jgi:hypothetical protein